MEVKIVSNNFDNNIYSYNVYYNNKQIRIDSLKDLFIFFMANTYSDVEYNFTNAGKVVLWLYEIIKKYQNKMIKKSIPFNEIETKDITMIISHEEEIKIFNDTDADEIYRLLSRFDNVSNVYITSFYNNNQILLVRGTVNNYGTLNNYNFIDALSGKVTFLGDIEYDLNSSDNILKNVDFKVININNAFILKRRKNGNTCR